MTRVEMTLKVISSTTPPSIKGCRYQLVFSSIHVVMSSDIPTEQFVEQYVKLVPDADLAEFQKVLDMRGVRKVDQAPFVDHFR